MGLFSRSVSADSSTTKGIAGDVFSQWQEDEWGSSKFLRAFHQNEWVHGAVKVKAEAVAAAKLRLFRQYADGRKEEVFSHPALDMLRYPNANMTRYELMELTSMWLDLWGEAYFLIDRMAKTLTPLIPDRMAVKGSAKQLITHYEYTVDGNIQRFNPSEVLHFKECNPADLRRGSSPLLACAHTFDADVEASKWNHRFFRNNCMPSGILSFGNTKFAPGVFENFLKRFRKQYEGARNSHKLAILEKTPEFVDLSKNPKDMEFGELGNRAMRRILAAFRVSKFLLGGTEDLNRSTAEAAEYVFQKNSVLPRLRRIEEKLNRDFLGLFEGGDPSASVGMTGGGESHGFRYSSDEETGMTREKDLETSLRQGFARQASSGNQNRGEVASELVFVFDDPTPRNEELRIRKRESDAKIGARTVNELRSEEGLEPLEEGDGSVFGTGSWTSQDDDNKNEGDSSAGVGMTDKKEEEEMEKRYKEHLMRHWSKVIGGLKE